MPKYGYLVVEGPHDVEFIYRLLRPFGLVRVQFHDRLDEYFKPLVPNKFPFKGDLQRRVPVPLFLQSSSHAVAIHSAVGDTRLLETIEENSAVIDYTQLTGIGILLDTDNQVSAHERYATIKRGLERKGYILPDLPANVSQGRPRLGGFVLPDNENAGNLEDLLIECAQRVYPELLGSARQHVELASNVPSLAGDGEDLSKTQIRNKAVVGSIASVLRPGKAIQTSIQDNKWVRGESLQLERIKAVQNFLADLLELPISQLRRRGQ